MDCVKRLYHCKYGGFEIVDFKLLGEINAWCNDRNKFVHGLVSLNNYEEMDVKFKSLANRGLPLVCRLYEEGSKIREWYYAVDILDTFPERAVQKCRLKERKDI